MAGNRDMNTTGEQGFGPVSAFCAVDPTAWAKRGTVRRFFGGWRFRKCPEYERGIRFDQEYNE
jgi:hypothetical protein